jgi:hypothetical protein
MADREQIKVDIVERIGALDKPNENGWTRELNLVSWNGGAPKLDVREWSPDHSRMSRGITLTEQQGIRFAQLLVQREKNKQRQPDNIDYRR